MKKISIIGLSILLILISATNCFATSEELKTQKITDTVLLENTEQYKNNIKQEIVVDEINYKLKDITEQENKVILTKDKEIKEEKIVKINDKYKVLNLFETKKETEEDGYSGILELQNDSLKIKVHDSYIEEYKVTLTKEYNNVDQNELNNIPKTIEQDGTTYYLVNPVWNIAQTQKIDGQDIPISYNGIMNYEGVKERTIITSYLATVNYKGILEKEVTESITYNIDYEEIPQEKTNYIPIVATTTAGIIFFSGIIIFKRKNATVYNFQNQEWKLVKKCHVSKNNKLIDVTPLTPMTHKYKIKLSTKAFNELLNDNVTIKYFDQQFIYKIKEKEFEIFV